MKKILFLLVVTICFCGCGNTDITKEEPTQNIIEKYSENKVYRINYNKDKGAITLAC